MQRSKVAELQSYRVTELQRYRVTEVVVAGRDRPCDKYYPVATGLKTNKISDHQQNQLHPRSIFGNLVCRKCRRDVTCAGVES